MLVKIFVERHGNLVEFAVPEYRNNTKYYCTALEWELYEQMLKLHEKYGVPEDDLEDICRTARAIQDEDNYY